MNWFRRFMIGRNGVDQLSVAFIVMFIVLNIVSLIFPSIFVYILYFVLFGLFLFRMLSKNISARQKENYAFLRFWNPLQKKVVNFFARLKSMKQYKYFKCKQCKRTIRVPRGKNKIRVTCPHCGHKEVIKS